MPAIIVGLSVCNVWIKKKIMHGKKIQYNNQMYKDYFQLNTQTNDNS